MWIGVGSMGERLFTEMRVIWRLEVLALGRLTVPPTTFCWLPLLTPPTQLARLESLCQAARAIISRHQSQIKLKISQKINRYLVLI
jgi:hypothetical protein